MKEPSVEEEPITLNELGEIWQEEYGNDGKDTVSLGLEALTAHPTYLNRLNGTEKNFAVLFFQRLQEEKVDGNPIVNIWRGIRLQSNTRIANLRADQMAALGRMQVIIAETAQKVSFANNRTVINNRATALGLSAPEPNPLGLSTAESGYDYFTKRSIDTLTTIVVERERRRLDVWQAEQEAQKLGEIENKFHRQRYTRLNELVDEKSKLQLELLDLEDSRKDERRKAIEKDRLQKRIEHLEMEYENLNREGAGSAIQED